MYLSEQTLADNTRQKAAEQTWTDADRNLDDLTSYHSLYTRDDLACE